MEVGVEQGGNVFRGLFDSMFFQKRTGDQGIGRPGERDAGKIFHDAESLVHGRD